MDAIICFSKKLSNKQYPIICCSSLYLPAGVDSELQHPSVHPNLCFVSLCLTPPWREERISLLLEDKTLRKRSRITGMWEVETYRYCRPHHPGHPILLTFPPGPHPGPPQLCLHHLTLPLQQLDIPPALAHLQPEHRAAGVHTPVYLGHSCLSQDLRNGQ